MRVAVVGCAGSGKSTLATQIARRFDLPFHELDAFHHQPGWVQKDSDSMTADVKAVLESTDRWVFDGNYNSSGGRLVRSQADLIVFLDLPRPVVMRQVVFRTLRRVLTRQELWNGNREPWSNVTSWRADENIIRYAWDNHARMHRQYNERIANGEWDHAEVVILRSRTEAVKWLASLSG